MTVPTNDWREVAPYHLENARFRPVENGYAVVRAASNGISAIVSPRGTILAARNHLLEGAGFVSARVPLLSGGAAYSWAGDWVAAAAALLLVAGGFARRRPRGSLRTRI